MTHNDWKFIKDGHVPEDGKECWLLVYDKMHDYITVRIGIRNNKYSNYLWDECSDCSYFDENDVILAWIYYEVPVKPEYPQLTGGEFVNGDIYV